MKTKFKTTVLSLIVAGAAFLALSPQLAHGASGVESFNITNQLVAGATTATGNPTNASGVLTGGAINVENYDSVDITVEGANTIGGVTNIGNTTSNYIYIGVVRAEKNTDTSSWETAAPWWSVKVPMNGTTRVVYHTNLALYSARFIGVYAASNSGSSGIWTNGVDGHIVRVVKKITPTVFP